MEKAARIQELNDAFRRSFSGGKVMMNANVDALPDMVKCAALNEVAAFNGFNEDVESRWRAVSHYWDRFRHPALRTGHASFPASGSLCAAHTLRAVPMVAIAR